LITRGHLTQKILLGSADFLHSGTGYIEIAAFVPCRFQSRFQSRFSAQWNVPFIINFVHHKVDKEKYKYYIYYALLNFCSGGHSIQCPPPGIHQGPVYQLVLFVYGWRTTRRSASLSTCCKQRWKLSVRNWR